MRISNIFVNRKLSIRIRISNIWCKIFEYSNIFVIRCEVWLFEENESNVIIALAKKKYLVLVFWHTLQKLAQQHRGNIHMQPLKEVQQQLHNIFFATWNTFFFLK